MLSQPLRILVALHQTYSVPHNKLSSLLSELSSIERLTQLNDDDLLAAGFTSKDISSFHFTVDNIERSEQVGKTLKRIEQLDIGVISLCCSAYPKLLKEISDPPPLLFFRGDQKLFNQSQLAVVGSRKSSPVGSENAYRFASKLACDGWVITSGMASGIDSKAHQGALTEGGLTIAVLGCGVDQVYPKHNAGLYRVIADQGLLISEFPIGFGPRRENFPKRNRIISGLSVGVLVVEAALKSGSLISARMALEQGREVFAIPGSIHSPNSKGCHSLIKQGAKLVESVEDIVEELGAWRQQAIKQINAKKMIEEEIVSISENERKLLSCIDYEAVDIETVLMRCEWPVEQTMDVLMSLEIKGLVVAQHGLYHRLNG